MIYAETVLPVTYPFDLFCIVDECNLRHAKRNVNERMAGSSTSTYAERMCVNCDSEYQLQWRH